jgi:hypothetical protein
VRLIVPRRAAGSGPSSVAAGAGTLDDGSHGDSPDNRGSDDSDPDGVTAVSHGSRTSGTSGTGEER